MAKKRILIIEDDDIDRIVLHKILSDEYDVLEAENGLEALQVLEKEHDNISLILLDIMMPVMNGYEFLKQMYQIKKYAIIPVIVMTLGDSKTDEIEALSYGATDFVLKPYLPQVLLHRVNNLIQLRESAAVINQFRFDRLTGLYSREYFYQRVREVLREHPDTEYTLFCVNIENFKLLNDSMGTEACDILLKQIAATIRLEVGETGVCGRYGADRFLYILRREDEILTRAKKIDQIHKYYHDNMNGLSLKWGIYEINDNSVLVDKMCDRALLAVSTITGLYNSNYAVYDEALRDRLVREKTITDIAEKALAEGQFLAFYQPQYSLQDESLIGAEALVRWKHPVWGCMPPAEFIPIFERNGFIGRLDRFVWEETCKQLRRWHNEGYKDMRVSVNISRVDVYQFNIEDVLIDLIKKYELEPDYLHLEITESAYSENPVKLTQTIDSLREHGFVVEMDDFGSGYSSLNMLSQMRLDVLKLDLKFISNETAKPFDVSILNDIVSMAHRLELSVVAEGVETREQLRRLRAVGCDFVQGYFFAKPMPVENFDKLLAAQRVTRPKTLTKLLTSNRRRLLVVDEDKSYADKILKEFGDRYEIVFAANSDGAIDYIENDARKVSAVILSLTMPQHESAKVIYHIRQVPRNWRIPIIASIPTGGAESADYLYINDMMREVDDFMCKCHPVFDLRRRVDGMMDILDFNEREKILQDEACRDYLTNLYNRRGLQLAIANIARDEYPLAICLFDLDNLKHINDEYGHEAGDKFIEAFANVLEHVTRSYDVKCRYGGDEFIVIFKRLNSEHDAIVKVEEILQAYNEIKIVDDSKPSCSVGIVLCGEDTQPSARLIERADKAMYKAKNENRGHCCVWHNNDI